MKKDSLLNIVVKKFNVTEKTALGMILSGKVLAGDVPVLKAGLKFDENAGIRLKPFDSYVSRGARKLLTAFNNFNISVKDKICIDAGSSTGGFTQVLLEKGALKVIAVDSGTNQLHYTLRYNPKVIVFENIKITDFKKEAAGCRIGFGVMDISFSSSVNIIRHLFNELQIEELIALIKPQFEYERLKEPLQLAGDFKGVVSSEEERNKIINYIKNEINISGFTINGIIDSGIKGTKGNIEYLFHILKK